MNFKVGFVTMVFLWGTMAMIPIAKLLPYDAYLLTFVRGVPAVVIAGLLLFFTKGKVQLPSKNTVQCVLAFTVAAFALFQAIIFWGPGLSAVILDMAVLVNFVIAWSRGEKPNKVQLLIFAFAIVGSFLAVRGWSIEGFSFFGLVWSLVAMIANGLFIECITKGDQELPVQVFWLGSGLALLGGVFSFSTLGVFLDLSPRQIILTTILGVTTGAMNFFFGFLAGKNLKPVTLGLLVLGVTPSILISSYFILGTALHADQLVGVVVMITSLAVFKTISAK